MAAWLGWLLTMRRLLAIGRFADHDGVAMVSTRVTLLLLCGLAAASPRLVSGRVSVSSTVT